MKKLATFIIFICILHLCIADLKAEELTVDVVLFRGNVTINGTPAAIGTVIEAYDPDTVLCGTFTVGNNVDSVGIYGYMPVRNDDNTTLTIDEGAIPGDSIYFKVNGIDAVSTLDSGSMVWTSNGDINVVNLAITNVTIAFTAVDLPTAVAAIPGDTVRFEVGIRNDGNGLDFYGISSTSDTSISPGWFTEDQESLSYADPGETTYVYFDAILPVWGGGQDTVYSIVYTVFSHIDTTVKYQDSVNLIKTTTDIEDYWTVLPDQFNLFQNYPNPFNPTTTISFNIPSKSMVRLDIINILGQTVDVKNLGIIPSGFYEIEYDASYLSSGVYFYRLVTEDNSLSKKMILIK